MYMEDYIGKYADMRKKILEKHAPEFYNSLLESGYLEKHLASIQRMSVNYIERCVTRFLQSEEYARESAKDPFNAIRSLNMTVLNAEDAALRLWIGVLPEDDEDEDEYGEYDDDDDDDDDEDYDDYPF